MNLPLPLNTLPIVDIGATLALVAILLLARHLAGQAIRARTNALPHHQRRWIANVRNLLLILGVIGLVMIWAPQLRTFALSLTAVAVALVIATKELLLCVSGYFLRASSRLFAVGDWIEVAGVRGEVADHNVLVTILHEFETGSFSHCGRVAAIPNSVLLSQVVRTDNLNREFVHHRFTITIDPSIDVFSRRREIEKLVEQRYAGYREEAVRANEKIERKFDIDLPDNVARVDFRTNDLGKYRLVITVFCPTRLADAIENDIVCEVMRYLNGADGGDSSAVSA